VFGGMSVRLIEQGRWSNEIFNLTGYGVVGRCARRIWK
jgi:hypothetical protein